MNYYVIARNDCEPERYLFLNRNRTYVSNWTYGMSKSTKFLIEQNAKTAILKLINSYGFNEKELKLLKIQEIDWKEKAENHERIITV